MATRPLQQHLFDVHCNEAALGLSLSEARGQHRDEHFGPGGLRNHDHADVIAHDRSTPAKSASDRELLLRAVQQLQKLVGTVEAIIAKLAPPEPELHPSWVAHEALKGHIQGILDLTLRVGSVARWKERDIHRFPTNRWARAEVDFVMAHLPLDAERRHRAALNVLARHQPCSDENCAGGDCHTCNQFYPCPEVQDVAASYGFSS
jgi:hypothetical protein